MQKPGTRCGKACKLGGESSPWGVQGRGSWRRGAEAWSSPDPEVGRQAGRHSDNGWELMEMHKPV